MDQIWIVQIKSWQFIRLVLVCITDNASFLWAHSFIHRVVFYDEKPDVPPHGHSLTIGSDIKKGQLLANEIIWFLHVGLYSLFTIKRSLYYRSSWKPIHHLLSLRDHVFLFHYQISNHISILHFHHTSLAPHSHWFFKYKSQKSEKTSLLISLQDTYRFSCISESI